MIAAATKELVHSQGTTRLARLRNAIRIASSRDES